MQSLLGASRAMTPCRRPEQGGSWQRWPASARCMPCVPPRFSCDLPCGSRKVPAAEPSRFAQCGTTYWWRRVPGLRRRPRSVQRQAGGRDSAWGGGEALARGGHSSGRIGMASRRLYVRGQWRGIRSARESVWSVRRQVGWISGLRLLRSRPTCLRHRNVPAKSTGRCPCRELLRRGAVPDFGRANTQTSPRRRFRHENCEFFASTRLAFCFRGFMMAVFRFQQRCKSALKTGSDEDVDANRRSSRACLSRASAGVG